MNYIKRTIILLILFVVVSPINSPKTIADNKYSEIQDDKFQLQPGDIIVTKGPVMWGFLVIVVSRLMIKRFYKLRGLATNQLHNPSNLLNIIMQVAKMIGWKFIVAAILVQVKKRLNGLEKLWEYKSSLSSYIKFEQQKIYVLY